MTTLTFRRGFESLLEIITALIVAAMTLLIVMGTVYRYMGSALSWYDEVASVGLVWMTYFGSALAALKGAHIGFPGIVNAMPVRWRVAATIFSEACIFLFFGLVAYAGLQVLVILEGMTLVSLPKVSVQLTQSIIPIGAALFMIAEAMRLPEVMRDARGQGFVDHEIKEALGDISNTPLESDDASVSSASHRRASQSGDA
ncbi:TRAP transporter small permease [Paracoccus zhejiangensis]|uniref:TRAP transporter small permease protein n=1 Tax=Paracoccus zhejiangensis TaxID=1077935 RepID=A0A2H5EZT9_9RHOB|nr:TRAP transporter small permease [Paracoccus zhejiangensis]AUH64800.1 C4-dicarboxylate ABC transporter permease [Paracoccus zhejiangensis]